MSEKRFIKRTPAKQKAKILAKYFRSECPDYFYLKSVFRHLRNELEIQVATTPKRLPYVPMEKEIQKYYETVWETRNMQHMVIIKILLYTGVRVSELELNRFAVTLHRNTSVFNFSRAISERFLI